jgi:uncharacterized protein
VDGLLRGILGIVIGAGLYSEVYPLIQNKLLMMGNYGKLTLPGMVGVNHWVVIVPMVVGCGALLVWLDRKGL